MEMMPANLPGDVNQLLRRLDSRDEWTRWQLTLRDYLTYILDVFSVPKTSFFEYISHFAMEDHEAEKLREFTTPEGQEDLLMYCIRPRRTIYEVLLDFPSVNIPLWAYKARVVMIE